MRLFYEAWEPCLLIRSLPTNELELRPNCSSATNELSAEDCEVFLSVGFSHHVSIFMAVKNFDERLYYIHACAKENWTVIELERHLRADDYHHVGALPNNFAKTLSPMTLATKAVRSFRDLSGASQHPRALQGSCSGHRRRPPRPGRARARDKKGAWLKSCRLRVDGFAEHLI